MRALQTHKQQAHISLNKLNFDSSENLGDLFDDVNSPVYTPPILDTTGETLYRTNSINDIYHNNTTSSEDVQQPRSDENNEHSLIGGNISQIENNESNSAIAQHDNPRTSSPLPQSIQQRTSGPWPNASKQRKNCSANTSPSGDQRKPSPNFWLRR